MKIYFVYILQCSDDSYYVGITSDLEKRLNEHQSGKYPTAYTYHRRPLELVWYQDFLEPNQAISFEKKLKKWSRAKKEAIILDQWEDLPKLSECKNHTHFKNFIKPKKS